MDNETRKKALKGLATRLVPPPLLAAALAHYCHETFAENPKRAENMLRNAWGSISECLAESIKARVEKEEKIGEDEEEGESLALVTALFFLNSYFSKRGDWKKMQADLEGDVGDALPEAARKKLITVISEILRNRPDDAFPASIRLGIEERKVDQPDA